MVPLSGRFHSPCPQGLDDDLDTLAASPSSIKNTLQELLQKNGFLDVPKYLDVSRAGPSHKPSFTVKCVVMNNRGQVVTEVFGTGKAIKEAEKTAAENMLQKIEDLLIEDPLLQKQVSICLINTSGYICGSE